MSTITRRTLITSAGLTAAGTALAAPASAWDASRLGPSTLRPGDRGSYVKTLQWALNKVGGASLLIDGVYGTGTTRAVRTFQSRQGLWVDGIAGSATKRRLDALLDAHYAGEPVTSDLLPYVSRITPVASGRPLRPGASGTRVKLVLQRLRVPHGQLSHTMTPAAVSAVKAFQRSRGLSADGVVGPTTWRALGLTTWQYHLDGYQKQPTVAVGAGGSTRIEAMISYARAQRGADYTWGGAGPYAYGFDCSGLVLQSMYAAGVDPRPIDVLDHQSPGFRTTRNLYSHPRLRRVSLASRRRGDLVWYTGSSGAIQHVAIYLGGGMIVDSLYSVRVRQDSAYLDGYRRLGTVSRVFA